MRVLKMLTQIHEAVHIISVAWHRYRKRKRERYLAKLELIARRSLKDGGTTPETSTESASSDESSVVGGGGSDGDDDDDDDLGRAGEQSAKLP